MRRFLKRWKKVLIGGFAICLFAFLTAAARLHAWGVDHVQQMTGDTRWQPDCLKCHMQAGIQPAIGSRHEDPYRSPAQLALSPDGRTLYVSASGCDKVLVVDPQAGKVQSEIPVGRHPFGICVSASGDRAFVANRWSGTVCEIDTAGRKVARTFPVGDGPIGVALGAGGHKLFTANYWSNDISVVDLASGQELTRLPAGRSPSCAVASPDGSRIYVGNQLSNPVPFRTSPVGEVTVVDANADTVAERRTFYNAHMIESVAVSPAAAGHEPFALATLVRPKNLVPAAQVARGWMITNGMGIMDLAGQPVRLASTAQEVPAGSNPTPATPAQVLLDDPNYFYADPSNVAITPDGKKAYVSHSGADIVTAIDMDRLWGVVEGDQANGRKGERRRIAADCALCNRLGVSKAFVTARIKTAPCPKGMAVSPDGRYVYVAARLGDKVQVISTEQNAVVRTIDLGGPPTESLRRRGERLFHNAGHTFQGQFSCRSCHPDGHMDGLIYDLESNGLGINLVQNRSLQLVNGTEPLKWSGVSTSFYRQCGMRFAAFITRAGPFDPDDLNALVAHIISIEPYPNIHRRPDGTLTDAQKRGKVIFERTVDTAGKPLPPLDRCSTCHSGPKFTDHKLHDVDTAGPMDTRRKFDTAHLVNVYQHTGFLHDGRAATMEEIWTKYGTSNRHGAVNDLQKEQLNDLIEYLKTL